MPFAKLSDVRIHYCLVGPDRAPILVFSNSLGTDFRMWELQISSLESRFRILRYDTRGHGQSSVTPGPCSIAQLAQDVLGLLDFLKLDRVHFCGLSMGGQIGMSLAMNAPNRLDRLILCSTAAKIGTAEEWKARIETVSSGGVKAVAPTVISHWFTPAFQSKAPELIAPVLRMLETANADGYIVSCMAVRDFDARAEIVQIRTPTLVINGAQDPATTPADGRFLAQSIPGARYAELNAAHLCNIEDRDRFGQELTTFFAR